MDLEWKEQEPVVKRHAKCPSCGDERIVEHLFDRKYPNSHEWYCRKCPSVFHVRVEKDKILVALSEKVTKRIVYVLRRGELVIFVEHTRFRPEEDDYKSDKYYYEEHTCPTNYLSNVVELATVIPVPGSDRSHYESDAHGAFKLIGELHCNDPYDNETVEDAIELYLERLCGYEPEEGA